MNLDLDSWGGRWEDIGRPLPQTRLGPHGDGLADAVIGQSILHAKVLFQSVTFSLHFGQWSKACLFTNRRTAYEVIIPVVLGQLFSLRIESKALLQSETAGNATRVWGRSLPKSKKGNESR